jgi:hypothetical protein
LFAYFFNCPESIFFAAYLPTICAIAVVGCNGEAVEVLLFCFWEENAQRNVDL